MTLFANVERLLASLVALLLFTLNEVRMFQSLPRSADPGDGRVHAVWMQIGDAPAHIYLSVFDLSLRLGASWPHRRARHLGPGRDFPAGQSRKLKGHSSRQVHSA
ncbi:MAG: hypothetical protein M0D54_05850 [Hyphomonadaceae bacterium JAD_PAG50586_4]|nr:MAG: hypothetical protein M0D54_05850 [Hyphomonadaceae bacterium JAD_PAG50586_4]